MIFDISNEYQDIYADLYKLNSDFSGWLCEERIPNMLELENRPEIGVILGLNW